MRRRSGSGWARRQRGVGERACRWRVGRCPSCRFKSSVRVGIGFSFRFEISQVFASLPLNLVIFMYIVLTKVQNLEVIYKIP